MKLHTYNGSLNHRNKLPKQVLVAYRTYKNQLSRCRNKKIKSYRDYGAKGIDVDYSAREFVGWYILEINKFKWTKPVVGRIDHSKNYSLNNIEIQEWSYNSSEAMLRTSHRFSMPVLVYIRESGKLVARCKSIKEASSKFGNSFSQVQRICNNKIKKSSTKYNYKFEGTI